MKPHADTRLAVAVRMDDSGNGQVLARGCDELAQRIIARAREHGIPVTGNRDLAAALMQIDMDLPVPDELLLVVCEVIAFVLEAEEEMRSVVEPVAGQPDEDCIQAL